MKQHAFITTNASECRKQVAPLYCRYSGQNTPQKAYMEIDPQEKTLFAKTNSEIGSAVTLAVWNACVLRLPINEYITGESLADLLEDDTVLLLASDICNGHSINSRGIGRLSSGARLAFEELEKYIESEESFQAMATVYFPGEWLSDSDNLGITSETTDAQLDALADKLIEETKAEKVLIDGDLREWLGELRDDLFETHICDNGSDR